MKQVKLLIKKIFGAPSRLAVKNEYLHQKFTRFNERPIEFAFVFKKLGEIYPVQVLDVGTGTTALPHMMRNCGCVVTAIDNIKDYWPAGMSNRHYHILDHDITGPLLNKKFDMITCISVLEHIEKFDDAVKNMMNMLNPGGHLVITCPYSEPAYVKNVYALEGSAYGKNNPFITQSYARKNIDHWLTFRKSSIVEQEYWQFWDGDYWTVGKQTIPPVKATPASKHQLMCIHIQVF